MYTFMKTLIEIRLIY